MIGREAPLDFFRRSGIPIRGEWRLSTWLGFSRVHAVLLLALQLEVRQRFYPRRVRATTAGSRTSSLRFFAIPYRPAADEPIDPAGNIEHINVRTRLLLHAGLFGLRRRSSAGSASNGERHLTSPLRPHTLMVIQVLAAVPIALRHLCLCWVTTDYSTPASESTFADNLFPEVNYGHQREYWRAFGFILAWPLFIWNFFHQRSPCGGG